MINNKSLFFIMKMHNIVVVVVVHVVVFDKRVNDIFITFSKLTAIALTTT